MTQIQRFKNKVVIVTGAAQGIGRGVALAIAREGGQLVLADRSALINDMAAEISELKAHAIVVNVDLETYAGARQMVDAGMEAFGRVDILINNVGGTIWAKPYQEYEEAQIEAEIRRSLFPTLWSCRATLPVMIAQKQGVIVNVSSIATRSINRVPYAAAKGGVNALTASLAFEHAGDGIRVNAIATGGTEAPPRNIPRNANPLSKDEEAWYQDIIDQTVASSLMHRYGTITEQVNAILFLASDESSYITGTVLPVGGGDLG
ncbi:1,6-dihydroxycyclohexa-2,4-diene-1-carboxylate dehydrogenase [Glaciimonas sp. CA11.2]|uniref:1,6-dihydroxycyclohexa-2,4-diene-1-carboxylate dehydrogenase n=1 Tax=unclassified Glaciimonas TaxID=2644401 RepID=UPI002AB3DF35|nr:MULTISPECIES: 1,6-dihydroxycyclohexa-2,4-diene-1-carboxylate dehydrogenase [unclassified Glaciimonas]MDY7544751.1 1,6-dihydroxycyclohexa-2,4-diene-1-carboxylate dehydrogenase [Glaciimonas sp. CA11.2]MEB0011951.1 1,6-dihydroxycyclohexa-2,4-diene-1-carboxylate dehydrogenase [Glaciimonas sp. Cout2]MEB0082814.1 1,6-dihydroxycyclohexa-2,4-diene-1-carboxylate dehydrogenase [Glaciimonas sp. Gout2]MEB0162647.1 1,6-dihydroxycyclohexa-2,4-diene-1-carboxylate dehydrogenase [Glaciimonas sp. CA11.2]